MTNKIKSLYLICACLAFTISLQAQQGKVTVSQDSDIDKLLEYKKDIKTAKIFTVQVFNNLDPDKAQHFKTEFLNSHNEWPVEIIWNTPNYKVWVGKFATRLEADRALAIIKKTHIDALILQPKTDS